MWRASSSRDARNGTGGVRDRGPDSRDGRVFRFVDRRPHAPACGRRRDGRSRCRPLEGVLRLRWRTGRPPRDDGGGDDGSRRRRRPGTPPWQRSAAAYSGSTTDGWRRRRKGRDLAATADAAGAAADGDAGGSLSVQYLRDAVFFPFPATRAAAAAAATLRTATRTTIAATDATKEEASIGQGGGGSIYVAVRIAAGLGHESHGWG